MAKFTPGPWRSTGYAGEIKAQNGWLVCYVEEPTSRGKEWHEDHAHTQANARLIAAAPEMYEWLHQGISGLACSDWDSEVRALLARIDGEDDAP